MTSKRDPQIFHPVLGISRSNGDTSTCSKCGATIPDDAGSLLLWDETGNLMWAYCKTCERRIAALVLPTKAQR